MQCFYFLYCLFTYYIFFLILQIYLLFILYFLNNNATCHLSGEFFFDDVDILWSLKRSFLLVWMIIFSSFDCIYLGKKEVHHVFTFMSSFKNASTTTTEITDV